MKFVFDLFNSYQPIALIKHFSAGLLIFLVCLLFQSDAQCQALPLGKHHLILLRQKCHAEYLKYNKAHAQTYKAVKRKIKRKDLGVNMIFSGHKSHKTTTDTLLFDDKFYVLPVKYAHHSNIFKDTSIKLYDVIDDYYGYFMLIALNDQDLSSLKFIAGIIASPYFSSLEIVKKQMNDNFMHDCFEEVLESYKRYDGLRYKRDFTRWNTEDSSKIRELLYYTLFQNFYNLNFENIKQNLEWWTVIDPVVEYIHKCEINNTSIEADEALKDSFSMTYFIAPRSYNRIKIPVGEQSFSCLDESSAYFYTRMWDLYVRQFGVKFNLDQVPLGNISKYHINNMSTIAEKQLYLDSLCAECRNNFPLNRVIVQHSKNKSDSVSYNGIFRLENDYKLYYLRYATYECPYHFFSQPDTSSYSYRIYIHPKSHKIMMGRVQAYDRSNLVNYELIDIRN